MFTIAYREDGVFRFGWSTPNRQKAIEFAFCEADFYPEIRIIKNDSEIAMVIRHGSTEIYDQEIIREFALANAI